MAEYQFDKCEQKVAFIMDNMPFARDNYLLLILSYWQLFDQIDIPEYVVQAVVANATQPETITRARRKVLEQARYKQLLELHRMAKGKDLEEAPVNIEEELGWKKTSQEVDTGILINPVDTKQREMNTKTGT